METGGGPFERGSSVRPSRRPGEQADWNLSLHDDDGTGLRESGSQVHEYKLQVQNTVHEYAIVYATVHAKSNTSGTSLTGLIPASGKPGAAMIFGESLAVVFSTAG